MTSIVPAGHPRVMAHSRSHSQPVHYRYRPNAPMRSATTVPSMVQQNPPPASSYAMSQLCNTPMRYSKAEIPLTHSYMPSSTDAEVFYGAAAFNSHVTPMYHSTLEFAHGLHPMEVAPQMSPTSSPWISSNSSVNSDSCSGPRSSPASSMGFSPEPAYQIPYIENASWPPQGHDPYLGGNCVTMHEVFPSTIMESDFGTTASCYPEMPQQWQCHLRADSLLPNYESSDYCSSRGSPESISDLASRSSETVATLKPLSDSVAADGSPSRQPTPPTKEADSMSPQPHAKASQFQGQILEFSTPVAQAKSKGPKFAALPCPLAAYGCTSSFISKNEWKRHINTQHLRLEAWLCDQCPKRENKREFNRKDLFIQHLKRMHPPSCSAHSSKAQQSKVKSERTAVKSEKAGKANKSEDLDPALIEAEQRCHIVLRQPPSESACLFCPTNFSGRGSWEARIEHVAKHMEQYKKEGNEVPDPKTWRADRVLEQWLVSENVITKVRQRWSVA